MLGFVGCMKLTDGNQERTDCSPGVSKRRSLWGVRIGILVALLACAVVIWRLGTMDERLDRWLVASEDGSLGFTATAYPKIRLPPKPTLKQRLTYGYQNVRLAFQFRTRNPNRFVLGPQATEEWDISRLLHQCMWVSKTRYLIAKDVQGRIRFGTTNSLNGNQWAAAAERALRDNGMVVIRLKPKLVQVVREASLQDYIKAKLVETEAASNSLASGPQP